MILDFTKTIILENERALIRPLSLNDMQDLLKYSLEEPELWRYSLVSAAGKENLESYIASALRDRENKRSYPFLVIDKHTNQVAGSTRFYDYQENHKTVQLGFTWYGKNFQGTGLNQNCKYLMLSYAFEFLKLERVEFRADFKNKRSINAMKKLGCIEEGVLRSNCSSPTGRRDSIVLSILKDEWFGGINATLFNQISL